MSKDLRIPIFSVEDISGSSALHLAVKKNDLSEVKKLLSQGTSVNIKSKRNNQTPLHYAGQCNVDESHLEVASLLIKSGANDKARDESDRTPVWFFVEKSTEKFVRLFLGSEINFNILDYGGHDLLFQAANNYKNPEVVKLLIDLGLDVNYRDKSKETALHKLAWKNKHQSHLKVAEVLLENGADANAKNSRGLSPFAILVLHANLEMFKLFLDYKADINAKWANGENLLFRAARSNTNVEVVELLLDFGSNVNERDQNQCTPLHWACYSNYNSLKIIKCLLKNGADTSIVDINGCTPLGYIVGSSELIDIDEDAIKKNTKLLMKSTDFNVKYIENFFKFNQVLPKYTWKMILEHIAELQSLNIPLHQNLLDEILNKEKYSNYYKQCEVELLSAKSAKLKDSWITFYNLLVDGRKKLKNYAGNKDLIEDFKNSDFRNKFPIYGASMDESVKKGIIRRELFDKSSIIISNCLPRFNPNHLIIRDILNCILSIKDLSTLCSKEKKNL